MSQLGVGNNEPWVSEAACVGTSPEAWFPSRKTSHQYDYETQMAINICRNCPVRVECLQYALDSGEEYGIWGGLTAEQRHKITQRRTA